MKDMADRKYFRWIRYKDVNNLEALSVARNHATRQCLAKERTGFLERLVCTTVTKYFREQFLSSKVQVQDGNFSEKIYFGPVCLPKSKVFPRQIL